MRIGYHLGNGAPASARRVSGIAYAAASTLAAAVAVCMVALRYQLGNLFSDDAPVVTLLADIAPLAGVAYLFIGPFYASMATLRGQGRPMLAALSFLLGAFFLSVLLSIRPVASPQLGDVVHPYGSTRDRNGCRAPSCS